MSKVTLFTPLALYFALAAFPALSEAASHQKCAQVALRAVYFDNESPLRAENGNINVVDPKGVAMYQNSTSTTQLKMKDGRMMTFEKNGGRIAKVVEADTITSLDENCNLDQKIRGRNELVYDRKLCLRIAERAKSFGLSKNDVFACSQLEVATKEESFKRNQELEKADDKNKVQVSGSFGDLNRALGCAHQFDFENKKDGYVNQAKDYLSQEWFNSAMALARSRESNPAGAPSRQGTIGQ